MINFECLFTPQSEAAWKSHLVKLIMEKAKCVSDPQEEVRKLQEKVRDLEFRLNQKEAPGSRNGLSDFASKSVESDEEEGLVPVYDVDLDSKTWLVRSSVDQRPVEVLFAQLLRDGARHQKTLYAAVCNAEQDRRKDIDSRTFTRPKKRMGRPSLELFESISSLPKRADPTLSWALDSNEAELDNMTCSLLESSLINSVYSSDLSATSDIASHISIINKKQKVGPQLERRRGSLVISDQKEEENPKPPLKNDNGNSVANHVENVNFSHLEGLTQRKDVSENEDMSAALLESADFSTSLIDSTLMDANLMETVVIYPKPKSSVPRMHQLNRTFTPSPPPSEMPTRKDLLELNQSDALNRTFVKDEESPNNLQLNTTFALDSNGIIGNQQNTFSVARPGSTDSGGGDDDQLSSASESSHTSNTRLMSVGDVQHIARLQEQSLVVSTPAHRHTSRLMDYGEDTISPILRPSSNNCGRLIGSSEVHGYASDHSSRSPLSSLHSSPAGSPYGSSLALAGSTQSQDNKLAYRPNGGLQRKNTYGLIPPRKIKESGIRPPAPKPSLMPPPSALAAPSNHVSRRSGLRPPMVRASRASASVTPSVSSASSQASGLPRPAGTGIPRPSSLSRIPPPKVRSSTSQTSRKEWTDECY